MFCYFFFNWVKWFGNFVCFNGSREFRGEINVLIWRIICKRVDWLGYYLVNVKFVIFN